MVAGEGGAGSDQRLVPLQSTRSNAISWVANSRKCDVNVETCVKKHPGDIVSPALTIVSPQRELKRNA